MRSSGPPPPARVPLLFLSREQQLHERDELVRRERLAENLAGAEVPRHAEEVALTGGALERAVRLESDAVVFDRERERGITR